MNGHGGNVPVDAARREWGAAHPDAEVLFHNWWIGPRMWELVQELDPGASHASWMENFPWTRLDGVELPADRKEPLRQPLPAAPAAMREVAGDGQYGGFYVLPDTDALRLARGVVNRLCVRPKRRSKTTCVRFPIRRPEAATSTPRAYRLGPCGASNSSRRGRRERSPASG